MNWPTFVIAAIIFLLVLAIIFVEIRNRKRCRHSCSSCGGSCAGCGTKQLP